MGFLDLAKHGLKGRIKISYILVSKRERTVERERKEEEEEEEKKKRGEEEKPRSKVWNYDL